MNKLSLFLLMTLVTSCFTKTETIIIPTNSDRPEIKTKGSETGNGGGRLNFMAENAFEEFFQKIETCYSYKNYCFNFDFNTDPNDSLEYTFLKSALEDIDIEELRSNFYIIETEAEKHHCPLKAPNMNGAYAFGEKINDPICFFTYLYNGREDIKSLSKAYGETFLKLAKNNLSSKTDVQNEFRQPTFKWKQFLNDLYEKSENLAFRDLSLFKSEERNISTTEELLTIFVKGFETKQLNTSKQKLIASNIVNCQGHISSWNISHVETDAIYPFNDGMTINSKIKGQLSLGLLQASQNKCFLYYTSNGKVLQQEVDTKFFDLKTINNRINKMEYTAQIEFMYFSEVPLFYSFYSLDIMNFNFSQDMPLKLSSAVPFRIFRSELNKTLKSLIFQKIMRR